MYALKDVYLTFVHSQTCYRQLAVQNVRYLPAYLKEFDTDINNCVVGLKAMLLFTCTSWL